MTRYNKLKASIGAKATAEPEARTLLTLHGLRAPPPHGLKRRTEIQPAINRLFYRLDYLYFIFVSQNTILRFCSSSHRRLMSLLIGDCHMFRSEFLVLGLGCSRLLTKEINDNDTESGLRHAGEGSVKGAK